MRLAGDVYVTFDPMDKELKIDAVNYPADAAIEIIANRIRKLIERLDLSSDQLFAVVNRDIELRRCNAQGQLTGQKKKYSNLLTKGKAKKRKAKP